MNREGRPSQALDFDSSHELESVPMNRLDTELHRLYLPQPQPAAPRPAEAAQPDSPALINTDGQVRALVLELASAAGWEAVAALWQGLQNELELPAPAIAISGAGYQVWISLAEPVAMAQARAFLESLCQRLLAGISPRHVRLLPELEAETSGTAHAEGPARHARLIPAQLGQSDRWSAFISPHLAAMFADEPWLDLRPSPDAQADLLLGLKRLSPAEWQQAERQLEPAEATSASATTSAAAAATPAAAEQDPRRFLLAVMNDPAIEMGLRIKAAKALLPGSTR